MKDAAKQLEKTIVVVSAYAKLLEWMNSLLKKLMPKKYVIAVDIIVQGIDETGVSFSASIDQWLEDMATEKQKVLSIQFTTAANGRQTCNIVYRTQL